jgi:alpha-mannosidase
VQAFSLKPSDDGNAWIVRLFGASGVGRTATLHWSTPAPQKLWLSDLSEKPIKPLDQSIEVAGWELVTLRVDR